jgi:hypothetical protein
VKKSTLNVPAVKIDITKEDINSLMYTIIAKDAFVTNSGNLVKKSGVQVTLRHVTKFDIA